jgi:signal transduction histidine kinase
MSPISRSTADVAATGPGDRAILLPGLLPDAASFVALADRDSPVSWSAVRADPGLLFFLLTRQIAFVADAPPGIADTDRSAAAGLMAAGAAVWTDWGNPVIRPVVRTALAAATFATLVSDATEAVDPARAWAGGWLAYAGWLAVAAVAPDAVAACGTDSAFAVDPFGTQARHWGMRRAEVAWRLAARWTLPRWAAVTVGRLDASPDDGATFGGDRRLQAVAQVAVLLAEQVETRLFVADEFDLAAGLAELGLRSADLDRVRERYASEVILDEWFERTRTDPRAARGAEVRLAAPSAHPPPDAGGSPIAFPLNSNRRTPRVSGGSMDAGGSRPQWAEIDAGPTDLVDLYAERVEAAKLAAVAEFAAGASHEINNPLAVISGQSQYLLKQEADERRREALESIVRQTRRIHSVLAELMLFARPPEPRPEWLDLGRLVSESAAELTPFALERRVDIHLGPLGSGLWVEADPKQLRIALAALARNGIEAAPPGGWVRLTTTVRPDRLEVAVDDSGPGPDERSRAHLFDPFYSGRAAGRGRGLGLPAAWRLARENGGEVRYVPAPGGPTRFVLSLPAAAVAAGAQRKSA